MSGLKTAASFAAMAMGAGIAPARPRLERREKPGFDMDKMRGDYATGRSPADWGRIAAAIAKRQRRAEKAAKKG